MALPSQETITLLALDKHQQPVFRVQFIGGGFNLNLLDEPWPLDCTCSNMSRKSSAWESTIGLLTRFHQRSPVSSSREMILPARDSQRLEISRHLAHLQDGHALWCG